MASADLREELNCSICLSIYTDPVNLRCGHNFCQVCIDSVLDKQSEYGVYSCPECRLEFKRRPELQRNITLRNIAERFLSAQPEQEETGIFCTYCIHSPVPAVKSCLMCEAYLCANHLRVHSKAEEHVLSDPTTSLGNRKCSVHKRVLEYYCAKDAACICVFCKQDGKHRGHQVEPIYNASNKKKEKLKKILGQLISMRDETERNVQHHQKNIKRAEDKAAGITGRVTAVFKEIQEKLQTLEAQVLDDITREVKQNTNPVSDLIQQLEIKRDELCSKICHIEELCNMTDPVTVLREQESGRGDFCNVDNRDYKPVPAVDEVNEILLSLNLHRGLANIVDSVKSRLYVPENSEILLDNETAATNVAVSADLKIAYGTETNDDIDDTDDRFESYQVLSETSFCSGQHYWEAEIYGSNNWRVGLSYDSIDREGNDSVFGNTAESWCLVRSYKGYALRHDSNQIFLSAAPSLKRFMRLGIYLDYEAGQLSFYNLGTPIIHLHTFNTAFTEPLYAAIRVGLGVWVRIIKESLYIM
ncbi:nuclear factor 7, brain-like [Mixophyes fleayi]|uniref:nuclear factor 7, brain-like n=1 Tax=Mixophyes fleayi TaxID=3061075 RepID=UPI003F4E3770